MAQNWWDKYPDASEAPPSATPQPISQSPRPDPGPSAPSGYRFTKNGSLEAIPGGPNDLNDTLDQATTNFYAQQILSGAPMPAMGMGKAASMMRQKVMERVAQIAGAQGLGGADLATQIAHYKAGQKQIATLENQRGTTQQNEQTALLNGQQFMDRSAELPGQTQYPFINAIVQGAQRHLPVPGHDTIAAMDAAHNTFVNEYAKVVAGTPSGGGVLSDSARREAMQTMLGNYSYSQKEAAFNQMKADMANRMTAMGDTVAQSYSDLTRQPGQHQHDGAAGAVSHTPPPGMGGPPSGGDMGGGGALTASTDGTKTIVDSSLTPVRREYAARLAAGDSGGKLVKFLTDAGVKDPGLLKAAVLQAQFRDKHPNTPLSFYNTEAIDHIVEKMGGLQTAVNAAAQSAPGAFVMHAGQAASGNNLDSLAGALGGNPEQVRLGLDYSGQDHGGASLAGDIFGGAMPALAGEAALAKGAGMAAGVGRSLIADAGYGAFAGAGSNDENRPGGAMMGALAGGAGSLGGQLATRGLGAAFKGVQSPDVGYLARQGIPMTMGDALQFSGRAGAKVKGFEDVLKGVPMLGDAIKARQAESFGAMNAKTIDRALAPIGGAVGPVAGEEGIRRAQQVVSHAFDSALTGKAAVPDNPFIGQVGAAIKRLAALRPATNMGQEIVDQIEAQTHDLFDQATGSLSGENMQAFLAGMRQIKSAYKADPLSHSINAQIKQIEHATEGMFQRQAPEVMPAYNAAKQAYRRLSVVEDAVNRAKNTGGTFTPAQLGIADRANSIKYDGKRAASSGQSVFHDFQRAAQNVLPNKLPDSGTAGRAEVLRGLGGLGSVAAAGGGLGYAAGDTRGGAGTGIGLVGILAALYSKRGQSFLVNGLVNHGARSKAVGSALQRLAPFGGAAGAAAITGGQ